CATRVLFRRPLYRNINRSGEESSLRQTVIVEDVAGAAAFGMQIRWRCSVFLPEHLFEPLANTIRPLLTERIVVRRVAGLVGETLNEDALDWYFRNHLRGFAYLPLVPFLDTRFVEAEEDQTKPLDSLGTIGGDVSDAQWNRIVRVRMIAGAVPHIVLDAQRVAEFAERFLARRPELFLARTGGATPKRLQLG